MTDLGEKVALITGGGGGIGRATAREFLRCGIRQIAIVDIDTELGQETVWQIRRAGGHSVFLKADVSQAQDVDRYVKDTLQAYERIDVFFNNAGLEGTVKPIDEYPEDVFRRILDVNVIGVYLGMKYVIPVMRKQGAGSIINTASVLGSRGSAGLSAYVASKHAVIGLTRSAAAEVAKEGIRINAVCPSPIDNRMIHSLERQINPDDPESAKDSFTARIPVGRYGTSEEVAKVVTFIASDDASLMVGAAISVDGGRTAV